MVISQDWNSPRHNSDEFFKSSKPDLTFSISGGLSCHLGYCLRCTQSLSKLWIPKYGISPSSRSKLIEQSVPTCVLPSLGFRSFHRMHLKESIFSFAVRDLIRKIDRLRCLLATFKFSFFIMFTFAKPLGWLHFSEFF